jgi:cyanate permease
MVKKLGLLGVIKSNCLILAPVLALLPFIGMFRESGVLLKGVLVFGCLIYYILGFNIYTSIFVLTNNSVTQQHRAKVNGFSNGIGYVVKGFTPLLVGYTFAYTSKKGFVYPFDYHFVFTVLGCVMFLQVFLATRLPKTLEKPKPKSESTETFRRIEETQIELSLSSKA